MHSSAIVKISSVKTVRKERKAEMYPVGFVSMIELVAKTNRGQPNVELALSASPCQTIRGVIFFPITQQLVDRLRRKEYRIVI
jgi:hypothetical protein